MEITEERHITVATKVFTVRAGKALTTVDYTPTGKSTGRDIVIRNDNELEDLIKALSIVKEFVEKLKTTPPIIQQPAEENK